MHLLRRVFNYFLMIFSNKRRALLAAFLASISYAFVPIFLRVSESYVSANSVVFNRAWIGFVSLGVFKIACDRYHLLTSPHSVEYASSKECVPTSAPLAHDQNSLPFIHLLSTLLWVALPFFGTQMLWAWSIAQTTVASAEILHSLTPPITALASWVLFSQAFGRRFIVGVVLSTLGIITIFAGDLSSAVNFRGDGLALVSAFFYAAYLMAVEQLRKRWGTIETVLWGFGSTVLLCIPVLFITGDTAFASSWAGWLSLVLCALDAIVTLLLINYSLKSLSSALTATILLISPCLTAIMGWLFFSESLGWLNICGFVAVLVGIYFSVADESETIHQAEVSKPHEGIASELQEL